MPWTPTERIIAEQPDRIDLTHFFTPRSAEPIYHRYGTFTFTAGFTAPRGVSIAENRYLVTAGDVSPGYQETPIKLTYTPTDGTAETTEKTLVTLTPLQKLRNAYAAKALVSEVWVAGLELTQWLSEEGLTFSTAIDAVFLNDFTVSGLNFVIADPGGDFSATNPRNRLVRLGFDATGYNAPVRAAVGYATEDGTVTRTKFCGTVQNTRYDATHRTVTFQCINRMQNLDWKDFTDFGKTITDTAYARGKSFTVPQHLQPLAKASVQGTQPSSGGALVEVPQFTQSGTRNPLHVKMNEETIDFESYAPPYNLSVKTAHRGMSRDKQFEVTAKYLNLNNWRYARRRETIALQLQLLRNPVLASQTDFAAAAAAAVDWQYDATTDNLYILVRDITPTAQSRSRIIRMHVASETLETVHTLPAGKVHDAFVFYRSASSVNFVLQERDWDTALNSYRNTALTDIHLRRVRAGTSDILQGSRMSYSYLGNLKMIGGQIVTLGRNMVTQGNVMYFHTSSYGLMQDMSERITDLGNLQYAGGQNTGIPTYNSPWPFEYFNAVIVAPETIYFSGSNSYLTRYTRSALQVPPVNPETRATAGVYAAQRFGTGAGITDFIVYRNPISIFLGVITNAAAATPNNLVTLKRYVNIATVPFHFWQSGDRIYWLEGYPYANVNSLSTVQQAEIGTVFSVPLATPTAANVRNEGILHDVESDSFSLLYAALAPPVNAGAATFFFATNNTVTREANQWYMLEQSETLEPSERMWRTNNVNTRETFNRFARELASVWYLDTERLIFKGRESAMGAFHSFNATGALRFTVATGTVVPPAGACLVGAEVIRYTGIGTETVGEVTYQTLTGLTRELLPTGGNHLHAAGEQVSFVADVLDETAFDSGILAANSQIDFQFYTNHLQIETGHPDVVWEKEDAAGIAQFGRHTLKVSTEITEAAWLTWLQATYLRLFSALHQRISMSIFPRYALELADTVYLRMPVSGIITLAQIYGIEYQRDSMSLSLKSLSTPSARRWKLIDRVAGGRYLAFDEGTDSLFYGSTTGTQFNRVDASVLDGSLLLETRQGLPSPRDGRKSNASLVDETLYLWNAIEEAIAYIPIATMTLSQVQYGRGTNHVRGGWTDEFCVAADGALWIGEKQGSTGLRMVPVTAVANPSKTNLFTRNTALAVEVPADTGCVFTADGVDFYGVRSHTEIIGWRRGENVSTSAVLSTPAVALPTNLAAVRAMRRGRACWYLLGLEAGESSPGLEVWMLPDTETGFAF